MSDQQQDTELTLGVGKLLGLFFLLVVLCGVFFSLGYSLGRGSSKTEGSLVGSDHQPAGATDSKNASSAKAETPADQKTSQSDMTFYKAVEQKDPNAKLETAEPETDAKQSQPELKATPGGAFVVQVAAVSKKEDAEALQQALQRKQYPVMVSPGAGDKLFHVQIGPFAELKDAETMKGRLASDGYNAIVKK